MHSLPIFVSLTGRPVILLGHGDAAEAKRRLLERAGARIVGEDADAALAIVAIDERDQAAAATERLKARGILVNATDRPELCDFTLPAIIDRDPVLIAIGTGGASAGLAKALRQRLEAIIPASLGRIAETLQASRDAIRERWPTPEQRRHAIDAALAPGGPLDPLSEHGEGAGERWLAGKKAERSDRTRSIILRSADPDDLTLREARWLAQADTIFHRPDAPVAILDRARADAIRLACAAPPADMPPGLSVVIEVERQG